MVSAFNNKCRLIIICGIVVILQYSYAYNYSTECKTQAFIDVFYITLMSYQLFII